MSSAGLSAPESTAARPFVSVIVPVFENPTGLQRCLGALEAQSYPASRFEVLVVDNGSRRSPGPIVAGHPRARLIVEPRPGSYCARNAGIRQARGEILAFTDADCVPDQAWVERGVLALEQDPGRGLIGGRVQVSLRDPARPTALELFHHGQQSTPVGLRRARPLRRDLQPVHPPAGARSARRL
jgi:glycosyltransferase involved in cell wall biosynthesis